jgi:predicted amidohydrolase
MTRVAAVQIEPSHMDPDAGLARIREWTARAAADGAELVVFPELLIPGYPRFVADPFPHSDETRTLWRDTQRYHRAYVGAAQAVPGACTEALGDIARTFGVTLVVGVAEAHPAIRGTLWNTAVVLGPDGGLVGRHRKVVGVMHERLIFNRGEQEDVRIFETPAGRLGTAICFENHHPLYRRALGRLGEEIHCALWTGPSPRERAALGEAIERHEELGIAHALDTATFVVISSQVTGREPEPTEFGPHWSHSGGTYVIDPLGRTLASVPDFEEGIAIADLDLSLIETARLIWNPFSDDARDDLFAPGPAVAAPAPAPAAAPAAENVPALLAYEATLA